VNFDRIQNGRFYRDPTIPVLSVERTEGMYIFLSGGARLLDASGGPMVNNVGHGRPEVVEAMHRAVSATDYVLPAFSCEPRLELVERLQRLLPDPLGRIMLTSGGTEALEAAVKLARKIQLVRGQVKRFKVIGRRWSYHGTSLGMLACGDSPAWRESYGPYLPDWPKIGLPRCVHSAEGPPDHPCDLRCAEELRTVLEKADPATVSAFICEPIGGAMSSVLIPSPGYYQRLRQICDEHGVLFIADEVVTAFGRTGSCLALDHWDVVPDIVAFSKGLASGYAPVGGMAVDSGLMCELEASGVAPDTRYTFSGHPLGAAAANEVLRIIEDEDLMAAVRTKESWMKEALEPLKKSPVVSNVRGKGLLFAVQFGLNGANIAHDKNVTMQVLTGLVMRGVLAWPGYGKDAQGNGDAIILAPPFVVEREHIAQIGQVLSEVVGDLEGQL
jgi:adenosylmethionine-8-amino-7-oxononanoate aminotransferase